MTRIAIVEDNKVIRESLMEFVQADPECRVRLCLRNGQRSLQGDAKAPARHRVDGYSIA